MKLKNTLLVLSVALASSAWACPDLSGNWSCKDEQGNASTLQVSQSGNTYHVVDGEGNASDIVADGTVRERTYTGNDDNGQPFSILMKESAVCAGPALNVHQQTVPTPEFPGTVTIDSVWSKVGDSRVTAAFTVDLMGQIQTSTTTCDKI